ncbi:MAG TPA: DUF3276 family protein [Chitinophagaceae bacterium]|nr:DUF3276 family protein [Chitinophagaceae bacterium]
MAYESTNQPERNNDSVFSKRLKAGKRRTYFFDVKTTRGNDYFLTITESKKRFNDNGYDRHKVFLYKEDFNKFLNGLTEAINHVKTELMPDFDFDSFNHDNYDKEEHHTEETASSLPPIGETEQVQHPEEEVPEPPGEPTHTSEDVDKW